jgi:hypothetical protein
VVKALAAAAFEYFLRQAVREQKHGGDTDPRADKAV